MTPEQQYNADRRDLSPTWEELGPVTREAYETGAERWMFTKGIGGMSRLLPKPLRSDTVSPA